MRAILPVAGPGVRKSKYVSKATISRSDLHESKVRKSSLVWLMLQPHARIASCMIAKSTMTRARPCCRKKSLNGAEQVQPGALIRARYGTTNSETLSGSSLRTILVLRAGTSAETPYHKPHLPVKPGFWCLHGSSKKFLVTSRFISSSVICATEAVKFADSPIILRCAHEKQTNKTVAGLRKLSAGIVANETTLHTNADAFLSDLF